MSQFKIGDRVMVGISDIPRSLDMPKCVSLLGTIIADPESTMPGVEFGCNVSGHGCDGVGIYGNCFWICEEHIIKLED